MNNDLSHLENQFSFQKKEWILKWSFWALMVLFIGAGLMGLFGHGPLSEQVMEEGNFSVHYERYLRVKNESQLTIATSADEEFVISFSNDYFRKIKITQIFPEAQSMEIKDNNVVMKFSGTRKGNIIFFLEPFKMGDQYLDLKINGKALQLRQFIYF